MDRTLLELAIIELERLLDRPNTPEGDFQSWFEKHELVFEILGYTKVLAHPELREGGRLLYIPDFLVRRVDGSWEIFEIKRADTEIIKDNKRRAAFYSAMETYVSQCHEYSEFFDDKINRLEFKDKYKESIESRPMTTLVAGRNDGIQRGKVHQLLSRRLPTVIHQTYDDVLDALEFRRSRLYDVKGYDKGLSMSLVLLIEKPESPTANFVFDIGTDADHDRISLYVDTNNSLVLRVIDSCGVRCESAVKQSVESFQYGEVFHFHFEVNAGPMSQIVAQINGSYCSEQRLKGLQLDSIDLNAMVLGSDITGKARSSMQIASLLTWHIIPSFSERRRSQNVMMDFYAKYFPQDKTLAHKYGVEDRHFLTFRGNKFLHSRLHPRFGEIANSPLESDELVQEDPAHRPLGSNGEIVAGLRNAFRKTSASC